MDQNTGVRNAILVSDHSKVSKTQITSRLLSLHFLLTCSLNKFNDFLLKEYDSLSSLCENSISKQAGAKIF